MKVNIDGVGVSYGRDEILADVRLALDSGEFVGVLGPNGSGKSTLLRTVYRAQQPTIGRVLVDGNDVWRLSALEAAQRTAVLTQESHAGFDFTVEEAIEMGRTPHLGPFARFDTADRHLVDEAIQRTDVGHLRGRRLTHLSGGEKQRVLLARALAQQPRLLVLDEPTNHLDVRHQFDLLELVRGLGITVLAALHDLNLASAYCDRLVVLDRGRVAAEGTPRAVLTTDLIRDVFGVRAFSLTHPATGRMHLALAPPASQSKNCSFRTGDIRDATFGIEARR